MIKNKNNNIFILIIIYFICFIFISSAYSFFNEQLELKGQTGFSNNENKEYEYDYLIQNSWESGGYYFYHYNINVTYKGNENIVGWQINIEVPLSTEINGCYNANECVVNNNTLRITNASWNGAMTNNSIVTSSFIIKTTEKNYEFKISSINFSKNNDVIVPDSDSGSNAPIEGNAIANLNIQNSWGNTTQFELELINNSNENLSSWEVRYQVSDGAKVINIWGGNYILKDNILILSGLGWNQSLSIGETNKNLGFQLETIEMAPVKLKLISFTGVTENQEDVVFEI